MADTRQKNIVWLASYPKSGNTWSRIFLGNYLLNRPRPISLNDLGNFGQGDSRRAQYEHLNGGPLAAGDVSGTLRVRSQVLNRISSNGADINLLKTHNQNTAVGNANLIPRDLTRAAICFVRNPLDVVLSYAAHYGISHEKAAEEMADKHKSIGGSKSQVHQWTGNWSDHVLSWTGATGFPVHVMRYEDMLDDPETAFSGMLKSLNVPIEQQRLAKAIKFSSFNQVSAQERIAGFNEKLEGQGSFFRKGQSGQWKSDLDPRLVERIVEDHTHVMERFGYLPHT